MKNNVLIFALCFCVNTVVFGFLGYVKYKNRQAPAQEPVFVQTKAEPETIEPKVQQRVEPSKPLPRDGVVQPAATTYELRGDRIVRTGKLRNRYFNVKVLKEVVKQGKRYYLIQMKEEGYLEDFWIIEEESLIILAVKRENAFCSMVR